MLLPVPARRVHDRADWRLEELGDLRPGIRVGPPHEAFADHRHVDLTHRESPRSIKKPQTKRGRRRRLHSLKWLCGHYSRRTGRPQGSGAFHSRILTGFGRARLLPSLFISPRSRTGSAGASRSRENETALLKPGKRLRSGQQSIMIYSFLARETMNVVGASCTQTIRKP